MIHYQIEQPLPASVELNHRNRYVLRGYLFGLSRLKSLTVDVQGQTYNASAIEIYRTDTKAAYPDFRFSPFSGFAVSVVLSPVKETVSYPVELTAIFKDGTVIRQEIGQVQITPYREAAPLPAPLSACSTIICMTSYNPSIPDFERQIQSIIDQDFNDWGCLISDDCSSEEHVQEMKRIIRRDTRFHLVEHRDNVGFYANFERCLAMVPPQVRHVALADQDDVWYPNKLSTLLAKLRSSDNAMLVYSDMRIVHRQHGVLYDTFWVLRKNYYSEDDLDLLILMNTVTGAASLFRRELLDLALPFPQPNGYMYHDHWLAVVALASGSLTFVDEPLYDYMQHGDNVTGHSSFTTAPRAAGWRLAAAWLRSLLLTKFSRQELVGKIHRFLYDYHFKYTDGQHVYTLAETVKLRVSDPKKRRLIGRASTLGGLWLIHRKVRQRQETLNGMEVMLLRSLLANLVFRKLLIPMQGAVRAVWKMMKLGQK